jgi:tetratricopeptide (TPR) repeat protein
MKLTKAVLILCCLFCLQIAYANAAPAHTVRGVVITTDGTVVPEFTITVRHATQKPELFTRKRFKNGEFTISGLTKDKYQLRITAPLYIPAKLDYDFKSLGRPTEYSIVILHTYRNEARLQPGAAYTVSVKALQEKEKIPDAARDAYMKGVQLHREGSLDQALVEYGKALRAYPKYVQALGDLATIFILYNHPDSALTFLRRAHDLDSSNVLINLNTAIALTEQQDYSSAVKIFKNILSTNPHLGLAQYYLAKVYYIQKKYEVAEDYVQQAMANDTHLLEASLLMINISLQEKKYEQAREALLRVRQATDNTMISKFIDEQLSTLGS